MTAEGAQAWEAWDWIKAQICHPQLCDFGQDTQALGASSVLYVTEGLLQFSQQGATEMLQAPQATGTALVIPVSPARLAYRRRSVNVERIQPDSKELYL